MTTGPYGDSPPAAAYDANAGTGPAWYPAPTPPVGGPAWPGEQGWYPPPAYPPQAYPPPGFVASYAPGAPPQNGLGTAALVLGIIGVVLTFAIWPPVILGILAIIFGAVGLGRAKRGVATNRGISLAGLILGIIAVVAPLLLIAFSIAFFAAWTSPWWGV